jgi:hypothetical protein
MSANDLWTPMRVKNFMRELKMNDTNWDENIVALAEKGSMSVEEFLETNPINFGERIWGKHDNPTWAQRCLGYNWVSLQMRKEVKEKADAEAAEKADAEAAEKVFADSLNLEKAKSVIAPRKRWTCQWW